jgi:DNA-binding XRE family transcriptional regulator
MLNWSQEELALKVECAKKTITDFEKGHRTPHHRTLKEIKIIFEEAGIRFIDSDGIGVKLMDKNT